MNSVKTTLSRAYRLMYEGICGRYPSLRPWHFQWLAGHYVCGRLKKMLPGFGGRILDVGCADKPFRDWFGAVTEYVGLDVVPGPNVDVVVSSKERWPFPDGYFDVVFSTQVLEHAEHLGITLSEIRRVLKKEGRAVLTFPFLYNEHGNPSDYRRFTVYGAEGLFPDFEIVCLEKQGGNWFDAPPAFLELVEQLSSSQIAVAAMDTAFVVYEPFGDIDGSARSYGRFLP